MFQPKSQRNLKRLTKKVQQKVVNRINEPPKENGSSTSPLGVQQFQSLEDSLNKLGDVVNHNGELFTNSLTVAEMRLRVLERVANDMFLGEPHTLSMERVRWTEEWQRVGGEVRMVDVPNRETVQVIDYPYYVQYFAMCMVFTEFTIWLKQLSEARVPEPVEEEQPRIVRPDYEGASIFGGSP